MGILSNAITPPPDSHVATPVTTSTTPIIPQTQSLPFNYAGSSATPPGAVRVHLSPKSASPQVLVSQAASLTATPSALNQYQYQQGPTFVNVGSSAAESSPIVVPLSGPPGSIFEPQSSTAGNVNLFDDLSAQESIDEIIQHIFRSIDINNTGRIHIEDAERTFLRMNTRLDRRSIKIHLFLNIIYNVTLFH